MLRVSVFLISVIMASGAHAFEKNACEFIDDDGSCNKLSSIAEIQLVKKGTTYAELRRQMLEIGYEARPTTSDPGRCGPELAQNCRMYQETVSCKSVGGADCNFVLYKNGVGFVAMTLGDKMQRVKSVHHLTIDDQRDLEASFDKPLAVRAEVLEAQPRPPQVKLKGKIDVPIVIGGDAKFDACVGAGHVIGLDPRGDGFLSVQSGPGGRPFREIDRLYNGNQVVICEERGSWLGVLYGSQSLDCGTGTPWPTKLPYTGPCSYGWIHSRYVKVTNG